MMLVMMTMMRLLLLLPVLFVRGFVTHTITPSTSKFSPWSGRAAVSTNLRVSLPTSIEAETKDYGDPKKPNINGGVRISQDYLTLPRHSNPDVNEVLANTETTIRQLHVHSRQIQQKTIEAAKEAGRLHEKVYANNYVDLAKVDTVGMDYDYTIVTYTEELLDLIYDMALNRLVTSRQYPVEMLDSGLKFDPFFSIRGLAVDIKTGWVCHLSSTHKVAVAFEGRKRVPTSRIYAEYRGKRGMPPAERKRRLRPLNDLFSMSECCLIADTVQFFKDRAIPFNAQNIMNDVLKAIGETHISGDFHRIVANNPAKYFEPTPHLQQVVRNLKDAGKRLIFVSNSPFWYVDAGMRYTFGDEWRDDWDVIVTSAGKPSFYTDDSRPFREVCQETRRLKFKPIDRFEKGSVYTEGCLSELTRLMDWSKPKKQDGVEINSEITSGATAVASNVLYIGDSLFADLVDAKREFSWTTAAVVPEIGFELEIQDQNDFVLAQRTSEILLSALRMVQEEMGIAMHTEEDVQVLNRMERLVSKWRDREIESLGNPFGSVFRARYEPSLFAHSLRRYCDLYMPSVSSLRNYSPQHRFYPEQNHKLLAHEIKNTPNCWDIEDVMECDAVALYNDNDSA
uniref:5'-nucleotidase domain-containing protein n=1 Tax=Amphora coffeiformis TaxID=265554 RepID=A0A7S3NZY5_9STRA